MAQLLQPMLVLVLVFTLVLHPRGVRSLEFADYNSLLEIKNTLNTQALKEIWDTNYRQQVKSIDPGLLKTKKRGRRAGVRVNLSRRKGRIPLPGIVLTNANSVIHKLDELHGLLNSKRLSNLSQIVCITESWLTPNITRSRTELSGYDQFRNDRLPEDSGKNIGGGILVYIDKKWATNNKIIFNHTDNNCELMTIKSRPHWLPREFSSVITISCYTPFTGQSRLKDSQNATINTILAHVKDIETTHPDACIMIMGDFNQLPIKLNNYYQIVKKPTRNNRTLDKCFVRVKNGYSHCHQLGHLGKSDHHVMHLIPTYRPLSTNKPTYVSCRKYSDENCNNLLACFDTTIWENLTCEDDNIDNQNNIISDYITFCTDLCIPPKTIKKQPNHKPWITKKINRLIDQKHYAHQTGNKKLYHKLKRNVSKAIRKSKQEYSAKIQQHLINEPARAWNDIKKLSGLPANDTSPTNNTNFQPNELNNFFCRFEKSDIKQPTVDPTKVTTPHFEIKEETVLKQLKSLNPRKGPGPDGIIPKVLKLCAYQLAPVITRLFSASIENHTTPTLWKSAISNRYLKSTSLLNLKNTGL